MESKNEVIRSLFCGASAGLAVDIGLFPLDTIKTRLQSKQGFQAAGGFKNIYKGMGSVAIGSAPGAAIFFMTYRMANQYFNSSSPIFHAISASIAEVAACAVRVPTELVKQRLQANASLSLTQCASDVVQRNGVLGLYRGYLSTIVREIPFSVIQFPLWEGMKARIAKYQGKDTVSPLVGAACGSVSGSFAAAITTPLDVAKTRIMLSKSHVPPTIIGTLQEVYSSGGVSALYAGVTPRVMWLGIGGFVFFGAYETALSLSYHVL